MYNFEDNLLYSGPYTYTTLDNDLSSDFDLFNEDTESGYVINSVTYDNAWVRDYRVVSPQDTDPHEYTVVVKSPITNSVLVTCWNAAGQTVPFYVPFFSLKASGGNYDPSRYLYCGVKVTYHSFSGGIHRFETTFGLWWVRGTADANLAATANIMNTIYSGGEDKDFWIVPFTLRAPYFSVPMPSGVIMPPADETIISWQYGAATGGTINAGQQFTKQWSLSSAGYVSFGANEAISFAKLYTLYEGMPEWVTPGPQTGPTSGPGGYGHGSFSGASDTIALPGHPAMGVTSAGFIRVYNIGVNGLSSLGFELFPPLAYTPPTPLPATTDSAEAIVNGFNSIVTFLANIPSFFDQIMANTLINYVIDCHVIPVSPGAGSSEAIHVGPKTLATSADRIYTDYVDVSCGSINVAEFYDNFADMLSTAKLYLPFVGFVPVRPEWFQGNSLAVDYKFNVIDGSFSCFVRSGGKYVNNDGGLTIVGQYAGTACMHIPITGVSYASMVSGLVGAGSGMVAGAGSGNIAAAASSAIEAATARGDMASSNAYSSSAAFLGCRVPFLMIERPVSSYSENYAHEYGFPANIYAKLGDVPGFVRMEAVHVDGIAGATESEKAEIKRLLAQGVIV